MEFTYKAYVNLIKLIKDSGYTITDYENYKYSDMAVILRHDVDLSVDKALELAKIEHKLGIQSTYFVLVTSPFYNVFSRDVNEKLRSILSYKHNIGLHFDELNYSKQYYDMNGGIRGVIFKEADILENALNRKIKFVSMHRPSENTLKSNYDLSPMVNSYGNTFFKEFKYISDSRRIWHEDVQKVIQEKKYKNIQILTHAFWYNVIERDITESIKEFIKSAYVERYDGLNENITNLGEILKKY